ncbi:MAG: membrane dipeptidase [Planctomycetota bacterium]|nr:membrane dipeptidase [Planctomycetota bacterium]
MAQPSARWIDGHLDLAYNALRGIDLTQEADGVHQCVSLPALRRGGVDVVFGTIFTEAVDAPPTDSCSYQIGNAQEAHEAGRRQLEWYLAMEARGELSIVRTRADLHRGATPRIVLLMECADPIRAPEESRWWFDQGVRVVGMAWGRGSRYAGGNAAHGGLTSIGRDLVDAFDALGILHDASHLADRALDDLLARTSRMVVATHSNGRVLLNPIQRHLRNDHLLEIAARGGVAATVLFSRFLSIHPTPTLANVLEHVNHVRNLAGLSAVALGSDLDGGFPPAEVPEGVRGPDQYDHITDALLKQGWAQSDCDAMRALNWWRVLNHILPDGA